MSGDTLGIKNKYGDPVTDPQIRQDGILDAIMSKDFLEISETVINDYNPIVGYFGETRHGIKHEGFDYIAPKGTEVKAVHSGIVGWIRIGVSSEVETCKIRQRIIDSGIKKENYFSEEDCKKCKNSQCNNVKCYGVQVWLHWVEKQDGKSTTRYAFYAHLSKLADELWNGIKDQIIKDQIDYMPGIKPGIKIDKIGKPIGYAGCTGNAWKMKDYQQHLHFECQTLVKGNPNAKPLKENPNAIVKTHFSLAKHIDEVDYDREKIKKAINLFLKDRLTLSELREVLLSIDEKRESYVNRR